METRDLKMTGDAGEAAPDRQGGDESVAAASQRSDGPPPIDGPQRRARRTLAQREAAAKSDLAALEAERRRLRTRGAIVAGTLLKHAVQARPALIAELAAAMRGLSERDREAVALFAPEFA